MNNIKWPVMGCQCQCRRTSECVCTQIEAALRAWGYNGYSVPMTPEQRLYCLEEIESVEGYSREDYEGLTDAELARSVLGAWTDYCRDKGLL